MNEHIDQLCRQMERVCNRKIQTPADFDHLSDSIMHATHQMVSVSTLKRIFGYVTYEYTPRRTTLDIMCRYIGYQDWHSFTHRTDNGETVESNPLFGNKLDASDLLVGEEVVVTWHPNRQCTFRYLGDRVFEVTDSIASKLQKGIRCRCHLFIKDEPLYLTDLSLPGSPSYICGKVNGVHWQLHS